ncbi:MAG: hypothetical protein RLY93_08250 [Sumerlaeia bacterium]
MVFSPSLTLTCLFMTGLLFAQSISLPGEDQDRDGEMDPGESNPAAADSRPAVNATDSDGDGLPDYYEVSFSMNDEYLYGLDPYDKDTDDDGISDFDELASSRYYRAGREDPSDLALTAHNYWRTYIQLDPLDPDSDDDGVPDGTEIGVVSPIPDGPEIVTPEGEVITIKGTDTTARYVFSFQLRNLPSYEGDEPDRFINQKRFNFRADADPGYGEGHYFTNPGKYDSNHDGFYDGLEDYNQLPLEDLAKLEDENYYNAPTNYNGAYDVSDQNGEILETDPMMGLHEVDWSWETNTKLTPGGGFFVGHPQDDNLGPDAEVVVQFYYLGGPSFSGDIKLSIEDRFARVEPSILEDVSMGKRFLITISQKRKIFKPGEEHEPSAPLKFDYIPDSQAQSMMMLDKTLFPREQYPPEKVREELPAVKICISSVFKVVGRSGVGRQPLIFDAPTASRYINRFLYGESLEVGSGSVFNIEGEDQLRTSGFTVNEILSECFIEIDNSCVVSGLPGEASIAPRRSERIEDLLEVRVPESVPSLARHSQSIQVLRRKLAIYFSERFQQRGPVLLAMGFVTDYDVEDSSGLLHYLGKSIDCWQCVPPGPVYSPDEILGFGTNLNSVRFSDSGLQNSGMPAPTAFVINDSALGEKSDMSKYRRILNDLYKETGVPFDELTGPERRLISARALEKYKEEDGQFQLVGRDDSDVIRGAIRTIAHEIIHCLRVTCEVPYTGGGIVTSETHSNSLDNLMFPFGDKGDIELTPSERLQANLFARRVMESNRGFYSQDNQFIFYNDNHQEVQIWVHDASKGED